MSKGKAEREKARARAIADKYFDVEGAPVQADEVAPPGAKGPRKLTAKEFRFCEEYIVDLNATQAAIRASYSEKTAGQIGYENLKKPEIQTCIADLMKARSLRTQWDADKMLLRLGTMLDADIAEIYDEDGGLRSIHEWPLVFRQGLIAGIEVEELFEGRGEDREHIGRVRKIKIADRSKILEMIGKHVDVQAFKDKVEHDVAAPLQQLYDQIVGTGIRPMQPNQAPGLGPPPAQANPAPNPQPPAQPGVIRPQATATPKEAS